MFFATQHYEIMFNGRVGFARLAKETGVDIIPVFTRNIRQIVWISPLLQKLLRPLYEMTRFVFVPMLGIFPVKLVTFIGEPIRADSADSAEELAEATKRALQNLIATHQTIPASITGAIRERFK